MAGRLLNYGTLTVRAFGGSQEFIKRFSSPEQVRELIQEPESLARPLARTCRRVAARLILPLTLPVGLEPFILIPSVSRPLTWSPPTVVLCHGVKLGSLKRGGRGPRIPLASTTRLPRGLLFFPVATVTGNYSACPPRCPIREPRYIRAHGS